MSALVRRHIEMNEQLVASRFGKVRKRLSSLGGADVKPRQSRTCPRK